MRFNHMELTLPPGGLTEHREDIGRFYGELFGWTASDVDILKQTGLLLRTDPEASQFILVTEQKVHIDSPGYDHLGCLYDTREEVDALLAKAKELQASDDRVQIKEYDDLVTPRVTTHAFYVRFLLPIWFDVQCLEYSDGDGPARRWTYA